MFMFNQIGLIKHILVLMVYFYLLLNYLNTLSSIHLTTFYIIAVIFMCAFGIQEIFLY